MRLRRRPATAAPTPAEVDIAQAVRDGELCLAALRLLGRTIGGANPEWLATQDPAIQRLRHRVNLLADELHVVRTWALEAEHFVAHLHPTPPSFMAVPEDLL